MSNQDIIKQFENQKIRSVWVEDEEEWYFSVVDVMGALTDSADPRDYIKKMRKRDPELNFYMGTNCPYVEMTTVNGKSRRTLAANVEQLFRIIQSVPSKKAEPFKLWLAEVGKERIDETIDPELSIERAVETYRRKGYPEDWIHQRILSIRVRKELTDEWDDRGVKKGKEYAILTDEITKAWAGMTTREYKNYKGLHKENLRDNMSTSEIVLNMLAEVSTTDISKAEQPKTFDENKQVAREGGQIAGDARRAIESRTGKPIVTRDNAKKLRSISPENPPKIPEPNKN